MKLYDRSHCLTTEQQQTKALFWTNDINLPMGTNGIACLLDLKPENDLILRAEQEIKKFSFMGQPKYFGE